MCAFPGGGGFVKTDLAADPARTPALARRRLRARGRLTRLAAVTLVAGLVAALLAVVHAVPAQAACANPVVCENQLPGTPQSVWDVTQPSTTIQGFADPFSVNISGSINFKINSSATSYKVDIYPEHLGVPESAGL
jgi:hypothetical protein